MAERLISPELCGIANYSVVRHLARLWLRRRFLALPKLSCQPQATVTLGQMQHTEVRTLHHLAVDTYYAIQRTGSSSIYLVL